MAVGGASGKAWLRTCRCKEVNYVDNWGKRVLAEISRCKGPEAGLCLACLPTDQRGGQCLEQGEGEEGGCRRRSER